ncbi:MULTISPECIES: YesL family protein [unclassified Paenibacillus]|uniref:YesL family protein n=1 Tax=unclassified Paenibacillus TaxID=185978 RepID=UPI0036371C5C
MKAEKANRFFEWVMNLALLNFVWIMFSLPLVTVFASSASLVQTIQMYRNEKDRESLIPFFWKAFVKQLLPATCLGIVMLLLLLVVASNFLFAHSFAANKWVYTALFAWSLFLSALYVSTLLFVFPVSTSCGLGVIQTLKQSLVYSLQKLPQTLLMSAGISFIVLILYFVPILIPIIGFSLVAFLIVLFADKIMGSTEQPVNIDL